MTEIDHFAVKERIVTLITADASIFDADDDTKLLSVEAGRPNIEGVPIQLPGAFITSSQNMDDLKGGQIISDAIQRITHTARYVLVIGVAGPDAQTAENQLDDFQKLILELLEADTTLSGASSAIVDSCVPERITHNVIKREGDLVQLRQITLKCTTVTGE